MVVYPEIDRFALIIFLFSLIGLFLHFIGNILSGRFQNRFQKGNFKPVTDDEYILHPIRIMHWIHMVCIAGLTFTGLCLRFNWLELQQTQIKIHHYCFMVVILLNLIIRIAYAFYGKTKTYQDFSFGKKDILNTPAVLRYYLFLKNDYPHIAKYASMQKLSYIFFGILTIIQGMTGILILWPKSLLGWLSPAFGSVELAENFFTGLHTGIMWAFIIITNIHAYIASMEGWPLLLLIFFNIEPKETDAAHE